MKTLAIALMLSLTAYSAHAACDMYGNCYNGGNGYNARTGRSWSSQSNGYGSSGVDSRGNSWTYDRSTGEYYNYGTGERRTRGQ